MDRTAAANIADGESLSSEVVTGGYRLVGIRTPDDFAGDVLTFQALVGGGFADLYSDAGDLVTVVVASPGALIGIDALRNELEAVRFATKIKVRAGTPDDPTPQSGDSLVLLLLEET